MSARVMNMHEADWGRLHWSDWLPLTSVTRTQPPPTAGLYRFRCRDEPGLLYVGEGANRQRRLGALIRARARGLPPSHYRDYEPGHRPQRGHYAMPCIVEHERRGCTVELSWTTEVVDDLVERRAQEVSLHAEHAESLGGRQVAGREGVTDRTTGGGVARQWSCEEADEHSGWYGDL